MDTIKILKSILGGNATNSKRVEEARQRPSSGGQAGGGLGDILGSVLGGSSGASIDTSDPGSLGSQLEDLLGVGGKPPARKPAPRAQPPRRQRHREPEKDPATILIRAMCNAAKVDGDIDRAEQDAILGRLGEVSQDEIDFVRSELNSPLDLEDFCDSVPETLAEQAYAFSVLAIKLDNLNEAAYLGRLASGLELESKTCNEIHKQVGAPCLYS